MTRTLCIAFCFLAGPWAHAQFVIDNDTNDLPRSYGETWWFDDDDSGNTIVVSNINSVATPDGPLPGWAWTRMNFMVASNLAVTEAGAADVVTNVTAAGPGDILAPGPVEATVTNNLTIGNLVTEEDFFIGDGATLTLDQGGVMFRGANHNIRAPGGSTPGFLTSSYTSGNGTNELFLTVTDNGTVYQIFSIELVDDGATPVTVVVDSYDMVEEGEVRLSDENSYTGGTIVNRVLCWAANDECFGSGPVTVRDNNATAYLVTSSGAFTNDFYIAGNGWVDNFFGPVGALRFISGTTLTGDIILTGDARIGNTSGSSSPARIEGQISGPFDLEFFEDGKFAIINSGHSYGNTAVGTGTLQLGEPGAPANLPSNTATIVSAGGELQGFTDYDGTLDLSGTLTPGFVHLPETNSFQELILRAGSTLQIDLSIEARDRIDVEDLTIEGGTVELNIIGEFLNGNYAILTYSNLVAAPAGLALTGDTGAATATLVTNTVSKQINVNVTGATSPPISWAPMAGSDLWDLDTSTNWSAGIGGPRTFKISDEVVISSGTQPDIQLVGALTPGFAIVAGTADFTFGGNGRLIGNGDLRMLGSGSLTISNNNDAFGFDTYKGLITVSSGGTLILGHNGALGDTSVGTVVESGGTLNLNGKNIDFEPVSVAGDGVGGAGAIVNHANVPLSYNLSDITLTNDTTFGGSNHWAVGHNNFAEPGSLGTGGQPFNLTKVGPNQVSLRIVDVDPALAQIDIEEGTLGFLSGTTGLGDPAATMNIESNAVFFHNNPHAPAIKQFDFKDGSEMRSQSSGNVMDGEVKLTGMVLFDVDSGNLTVDAPVIGAGGIEKIDGGQLIFTTSNTYAGLTHIKDGWILLGNGTPDGNFGTGPVTITGSVSRIGVNRTTDATVLNPISGRGVIELFGTNKTEFGSIDMPGPFGSIILIGYPGHSPTLHVTTNSDIRIEELITAINFSAQGNILQTGGSLEITDFSVPMKLGNSGGGTSVYDLVSGQFTSTNGGINVGFHGDAVWNISGGTATVARAVLNAFNSTGSGTLDMSGGVLEVGALGISNVGVPYSCTISGGTVRAFETNFNVGVDVTLENLPVIDTVTNTIIVTGNLSGPGGFVKEGGGTLVVNGTNSCSGTLAILDGTFQQDSTHTGAGFTIVTNDAVMTGSGATDGFVGIATNAALAPSPQLDVTGDVFIEGTCALDVAGAAIDRVLGISDLTLTTSSVLTVSGALTETDYVIMTYSTRSGEFGEVSSVTTQNYEVVYDDVGGEVRLVWAAPVVDILLDDEDLTVSWGSDTGSVYWLEHRTNMLLGTWMPLPPWTNLPGTGGPLTATNLPTSDPEGYFRVLEE